MRVRHTFLIRLAPVLALVACTTAHADEPPAPRVDVPQAMVHVPAGPITTGSTEAQLEDAWSLCESTRGTGECRRAWLEDESQQREVEVAAFFIDTFEVTADDYAKCVDAGACEAPDVDACFGESKNWGAEVRGDHPINCVDWSQADAYCTWVDKRLPTSDEWEKAARGTDGRVYPWGDDSPDDRALGESPSTSAVGQQPDDVSPYGVHDMAANVAEWTSTKGPRSTRVARGATFGDDAFSLRLAGTMPTAPSRLQGALGFRCARSAP